MDKFCVFCGANPQSKSKEHIIPKWLIEMTGDPTRQVYLGLKWTTPDLKERNYAFSSLTFPACTTCNHSHSALELGAHRVVKHMLAREPISEIDIDILLDWLDKIRTGIWLAMIYLNENYRGINPLFHIERRIASKDRFVIIYTVFEDNQQGVSWIGTDTPIFHYMPSCFGLAINNIVLLNASKDFLFSQRMGFPYPKAPFLLHGGETACSINRGTEKLCTPLVTRKFKTGGTQLFQPIIPYKSVSQNGGVSEAIAALYDNDYVRAQCIDFARGKGIILRRDRNRLVRYPKVPSLDWIPKQTFPRGEVFCDVALMIGAYLEELYRDVPSMETVPDNDRARYEKQIREALKLHKLMMDNFRKARGRL